MSDENAHNKRYRLIMAGYFKDWFSVEAISHCSAAGLLWSLKVDNRRHCIERGERWSTLRDFHRQMSITAK